MCSTALVVALLAGSTASTARADTPVTGETILPRARSAWDRGDWRQADALYKQALDAGGLSPNEALDAYIRLGSAESLLKKRDAALVAYRHAALLQPRFKAPKVAGAKGARLAALARKQEAKIGVFRLVAEVPSSVAAGIPLQISASLDSDHAAILSKVSVFASDSTATRTFREAQPASTQVHFTLPGNFLTSGATLTVRIDALDVHDNRMASVERLVHVAGDPAAIAAVTSVVPVSPGATEPVTPPPSISEKGSDKGVATANVQAPEVLLADVKPLKAKTADADSGTSHKSSFWSSPWPYVIGGAALAAGGAVAYFATRPGDDVTVGAARIDAR
jgi:hypothetical protein